MPKHKSISQRLKTARSIETKQEIALDWAANWHKEQAQLIIELGKAIAGDDYDQTCIVAGQLKAVTEKRFSALLKVVVHLTGTLK